MDSYTILLSNIHCKNCEESLRKVLSQFDLLRFQVSLENKSVTVIPNKTSISKILSALYSAGFDIDAVNNEPLKPGVGWYSKLTSIGSNRKNAHMNNCLVCKENEKKANESNGHIKALADGDIKASGGIKGRAKKITSKIAKELHVKDSETDSSSIDSSPTISYDPGREFRALFSVGGMTCASCVNSITAAVKEQLPEIGEFAVDLMNKSAVAIVNDKRLANKVSEIIQDTGYSSELVEFLPVASNQAWKITASIGGMTCSSCVNAIRTQLEPISYIDEVNVSLLDNSAVFIVNDQTKIHKIKDMVEDLGYEYHEISVQEIRHVSVEKISRTINLSIKGMFCK